MDIPENQSVAPQLHSIVKGISSHGVPVPLTDVAVLLHPGDNVAVARVPLGRGVILRLPSDSIAPDALVEVSQRVQAGHKVALRDIAPNKPVLRYGSVIGFATQPIHAGAHIHTHNLAVGELDRDYEIGVDYRPVAPLPAELRRMFMGYRRPDGKVGTRNYIAIISTVSLIIQ